MTEPSGGAGKTVHLDLRGCYGDDTYAHRSYAMHSRLVHSIIHMVHLHRNILSSY